MTDNYRARLEGERVSLRQRRIDIRAQLDKIKRGFMFGDPTHTATLRTSLEIQLRGTEPRWQELHHMLGMEHKLAPPVRIGRGR